MSNNSNLHKARAIKNDEFYTQYNDIANEVSRYKNQLKDKRIICPCDWDEDAKTIFDEDDFQHKCNFVKFLNSHKKEYGIKSITVSGYNPATKVGTKFQDVDYSKYDVVITNPPFSLFREFISKLMQYPKLKFLVIGPMNATNYKDFFKLYKDDKVWYGYTYPKQFKESNGSIKKFGNIGWFTNLEVSYRNEELILTEEYMQSKYPKYDNCDAINVDKISKIPRDYYEVMGVPGSFLTKYNPSQFKIIWLDDVDTSKWRGRGPKLNNKNIFRRVIIKRKK